MAVLAIFGVFSDSSSALARSSVTIEENVSATANSGGNVIEGSGTIKTGNASAASSTSVKVDGGGETKIEVKASSEANGKKVEAEVNEDNLKENISIQKEVKEGNSEAKVDIDISAGGNNQADLQQEDRKEADILEEPQRTSEEKNIFTRATENISNAVKNIFERIISIF